MNKKKLPKAIRQTRGDKGDAGSIAVAVEGTTEPARPAASYQPDDKSRTTTATGAAGRVQSENSASVAANETTPPVSTNPPDDRRRAVAMKMVEHFSWWSGAAGLIPVPVADLAAFCGIQVQMVRRISQIYDVPFSENRSKALIASLAGSMIAGSSGIGAASILKGVPVVGTAVIALTMPALFSGATYAIGMAFIQHFESGGTLLDFKPRSIAISSYRGVFGRRGQRIA